MMKRTLTTVLVVGLAAAVSARADYVMNSQVTSNPSQMQTAIGGGNATGGSSDSDSSANAISVAEGGTATGGEAVSWSNSQGGSGIGYSTSNLSLTTVTNVKNRTSPTGTMPPYLPMWNHGGWGTLQAYFHNGPTNNDRVYERAFDPQNQDDMDELRSILCAVPYDTPLDWVGAVVNGIGVVLGGPDNYHHGRGFEIENSVIRCRRSDNKPLLVFIDSSIDPALLAENGYAYVGRISIEGKTDRSWDQVYDAAVAEAMPWDIDLLLISGGMKGVTVGSNLTLPSLGGAYSQTNYSLSMGAGYATGETEGKGKAVVSASAYRYSPEMLARHQLPRALYERIRLRPKVAAAPAPAGSPAPTVAAAAPASTSSPIAPAVGSTQNDATKEGAAKSKNSGVEMSKELYQMAGFTGQAVNNVAVR
jgi:hypothetical protein